MTTVKANLKLSNPDLLATINDAAIALSLTEIQFILIPDGAKQPSGFYLNKLDPSKAAFIHIFIPSSDFEEFEVSEESMFCVDFMSFSTAVGRLRRLKEPISIVFDDGYMLMSNVGKTKREFSMNLLTPAEKTKEPDVDLPTKVVVDTSEMFELVKDLKAYASHATIETKDEHLSVYGEGDKGKVSVQTTLTELDLVKSYEGPDAKSMFSMFYINEVFKFFKAFEAVTMNMGVNKPIILTTTVGKGEIKILIAPRVERN